MDNFIALEIPEVPICLFPMGGHIFIHLFINKMNLGAGVTPHKPAALGIPGENLLRIFEDL